MRQVDTYRQTQETVETPHPLSIPCGEIVIHCDDVHTFARKRIQINRQSGGQCFAFTRAHLGNFAVVQRHATQDLHVKVPHLHHTFGPLTHDSKSLRQHRIQCFAFGNAIFEFLCLLAQPIVGQLLELGLQCIDLSEHVAVLFEQAVIATAEDFCQYVDGHECKTGLGPNGPQISAVL